MFDLITQSGNRPFRERAAGSKAVSVTVHAVVITLIVGVPLLRSARELPIVPQSLSLPGNLTLCDASTMRSML
jgi:hypothetical protein